MPRLIEATKQARRAQILDAAFNCFTRNGYINTSIADIIKESGLSSGSIYSHFDGKKDILEATLKHRVEGIHKAYHEIPDEPTPREIARFIIQKAPRMGGFNTIMRLHLESNNSPEIRQVTSTIFSTIREFICDALTPWAIQRTAEQAQTEATAQTVNDLVLATADALLLILHGFMIRTSLDSAISAEYLYEVALNLLPE